MNETLKKKKQLCGEEATGILFTIEEMYKPIIAEPLSLKKYLELHRIIKKSIWETHLKIK